MNEFELSWEETSEQNDARAMASQIRWVAGRRENL